MNTNVNRSKLNKSLFFALCLAAGLVSACLPEAPSKQAISAPSQTQQSERKQDKQMTQKQAKPNPVVVMETSMGDIVIELNAEKSPKTVENFLTYVDEGFYNGTVFHRVIKGFMIQGGGYCIDNRQKPTHATITNEASNGLKNNRGTIAMARTGDPHSATSQFFINHKDNAMLDFTSADTGGYGYCVFGEVIEGIDVVDKIADTPCRASANNPREVAEPAEPIIIKQVRRR